MTLPKVSQNILGHDNFIEKHVCGIIFIKARRSKEYK
jgi:hypothetical protein